MFTLIDNFQWMGINVVLAVLPIFFAYLAVRFRENIVGVMFFVLWLLFFPNTIYTITDLRHLPEQLSKFNVSFDLLLISQYLVLTIFGILTYFWALKPIVNLISKKYKRFKELDTVIVIFNFFVAFGVALGVIQRTESWFVIIDPVRVISDINKSSHSPQIILFVIGFGILTNLIWLIGKEKL